MKRIMLLLAVVAVMGMIAAPSAAAQAEPPQFCYDVGSDDVFEGDGSISPNPTCYDTMKLCEHALEFGLVQDGSTTSSCHPKDRTVTDSAHTAYSSMQDCRDQSTDPQSCRVGG